jgi:hypothetical protein
MSDRRGEWWTNEGWANHGSKLQIQLYVNCRPAKLTEAIFAHFAQLAKTAGDLQWRAPLKASKLEEPRDKRFLKAIDLTERSAELGEF